MINSVTNSKIKFEEKEGKVDMCVAIKQMCQESWDEGLRKGEEIGEERGIKIGEKRGEKRGIEQGISLINKLNSLLINTNRLDDLTRAANDLEYQAKLMEELLPGGR